ncbi:MAG: NAD-dependent succinate-semialdehyde dehydrogenase [Candidatus Nanopelagicales bacterium]
MTVAVESVPTSLFIGGEWVEPLEEQRFEVDNPADRSIIVNVADAGVADARRAADAAAAALPGWRAHTPRQRGEILRAVFEAMHERADQLADLIVLENGKPRVEAVAEVHYAAEFFRWFSEEAVRLPGYLTTAPVTGRRIMELSEPVGVALLLAPWNLPAAMITRKIAPALAAGCTVVIKPASQTPLTALALAQIMQECGVPAGVVNVITTTRDADVVSDLIAAGPVRALSFTGSTRVGRLLLRQASERVLRCSMELGGNAPFIVLEDADIELAVENAMVAKMRHNAEACTAANRFLVHADVKEQFTQGLVAAMSGLRVGDGMDPATQLGPMASAAARDGVAEKVDAAVTAGARVRTGGSAGDDSGYFYLPTVLDDVAADAPLLQQEIFGPVAPIVEFRTDAEALTLANAVDVGLGSYIHSRDLGRALRIAEGLEVGMVGINTGLFSDPAAPFGGVKESGLGREGGRHGIGEFLETKYINVAWS